MKKYKKIALALALALSFAGCVNNNEGAQNTSTTEVAETQSTDTSSENVNDKDPADVEEATGEAANDNDNEDNDVEATGKIEDEPRYGTPIKVAYNGGICTSGPGIASVIGEFEKRGLEVEFINVESDVDSIGTHTADATVGHITKFVPPTVNGVDMVFASGAHTGCKSLYVIDDENVNSTADLKGKTIGIPQPIGSSDHNIAIRFFSNDGIMPEEVNYKQVELAAIVQALENGEIQGAILSDEYADKFMADGTLKRIRSLTWDDDFKDETCCVNALNGDFVRENPLMAKAYNEAVLSAQKWMEDHVEEAIEILYENNWASGDKEAATRMLDSYNWAVTIDNTEQTLGVVFDDYDRFGIINTDMTKDDFIANYFNSFGVKDSDFN